MIKRFFQGLNSSRVSYLLISGQATVLYGAATFSEDIDLWVEPGIKNWNRFLNLLKDTGARIYKLTPPISIKLIRKGHGYHFQLPSNDKKLPYWFLDLMGVVPRVGDFRRAFRNVVYQDTDWGRLPVVEIRDLVEIKKTRRLEDYSVISNLVRIEYERLRSKRITYNDWRWVLKNSFEIDDMLFYLSSNDLARKVAGNLKRGCLSYCIKAISGGKGKERYIESASKSLALEIETLRKKDRRYWQPIINELKDLKAKGQLLIPGSMPSDSVIQ